ncbi:hypothetical protein AB0N05_31350 [Nocardia sp. NPDC051030]|uniref:hypothetical protein n=1 Tax=Nocardia sp. NPDC051030 TaxID=3155162 RepID=UPI0034334074
MRNRFRIGVVACALLLAPLGAVASASAVPLESAPAQVDQVAKVCAQEWPASLFCLLSSLSSDSGSFKK